MYRILVYALCAVVASPAMADTIYKSVRRDGSVIYSDRPFPGARSVQQIDSSKSTLSIIPDPEARRPQQQSAANQRIAQREARLNQADAQVKAAALALEQAQQRLEQSTEPLPGERSASVGGSSRLNDLYAGRLAAIQQQVEEARRQLEAAYAERNAARGD